MAAVDDGSLVENGRVSGAATDVDEDYPSSISSAVRTDSAVDRGFNNQVIGSTPALRTASCMERCGLMGQ